MNAMPRLVPSKNVALLAGVFTDTGVGDAGVANLAGMRVLQNLDLSGTNLSDAALASLARNHPSLQWLELRRTRITTAGLAHLAKLPRLLDLDLSDCPIDDDAIPALIGCRSLRMLQLPGTKLTPSGVAHLREALPSCTVDSGEYQP
jgi:hypothetical protein